MRNSLNFLIAGVGGQGIILASDVLVNVGLAAGFQAKQAEIHGLSQRGGSVSSYVRWGERVFSPMVGAGEVDVLLSFEKLEALRSIRELRRGAAVLINDRVIEPLTVISGGAQYPQDEAIQAVFARISPNVVFLDGEKIARLLGNPRVANVVLLGALSHMLESEALTGAELIADIWLKVITERVPGKQVAINQKAFEAGRNEMLEMARSTQSQAESRR